jgi:hypothetical protein
LRKDARISLEVICGQLNHKDRGNWSRAVLLGPPTRA